MSGEVLESATVTVDCVGTAKASTAIAAQVTARRLLIRSMETLSPRRRPRLMALPVFLTIWPADTDHMVSCGAQPLPRWTIVTVTIEAHPRQI